MKTYFPIFSTFPAGNNNYNDKKTEILKFIHDPTKFVKNQENKFDTEGYILAGSIRTNNFVGFLSVACWFYR